MHYAETAKKHHYWLCRCDCGKIQRAEESSLVYGKANSCGCLAGDATVARQTTHGLSNTPEYWSWMTMVKRCTNPQDPSWDRYGGRGIKVCPQWVDSFPTFLADMGCRPSTEFTLDRINTAGDYTPENCRWASHKEQMRNRTNTRRITFNGKTQALHDWAEEVGMKAETIWARIESGLSVEAALHPFHRQQATQLST